MTKYNKYKLQLSEYRDRSRNKNKNEKEDEKNEEELRLKDSRYLIHKKRSLIRNQKTSPKIFKMLGKTVNKKTLKHLRENQSLPRFHDMSTYLYFLY